MIPRGLQQVVSAEDVSLDKITWAVDGTVNVALCREVHHCIRAVLCENLSQDKWVAKVGLDKIMALVTDVAFQRRKISSVGELVEIDNVMRRLVDDLADEIGTDKARTTCYEYFHKRYFIIDQQSLLTWQFC